MLQDIAQMFSSLSRVSLTSVGYITKNSHQKHTHPDTPISFMSMTYIVHYSIYKASQLMCFVTCSWLRLGLGTGHIDMNNPLVAYF